MLLCFLKVYLILHLINDIQGVIHETKQVAERGIETSVFENRE